MFFIDFYLLIGMFFVFVFGFSLEEVSFFIFFVFLIVLGVMLLVVMLNGLYLSVIEFMRVLMVVLVVEMWDWRGILV